MKKTALASSFISDINIIDRGGFVTNKNTGDKHYISHVYLKSALDGDTVKVGIIESQQNQKKAKVEKIISRNKNVFTAKIFAKKDHLKASLYPFQSKSISIKQNNINASAGDIVKIKILDWRENHKTAYAKTTSLISRENNSDSDFLFVSRRYELNDSSKINLNDKDKTHYKSILKEHQKDRVDLSDLDTITIDPDNAGDFDDALSVIKKEYGYDLFVHIADVSAYVKEGDSIDNSARKKANSFYFPEKVFHMLPKILSTDLCSLKPNKKRLAMTLKIELDSNCSIVEYSFFESIITSNKRFSYSEASNVLKKLNTSPFSDLLNILNKVASELKNERLKNALSIDHHEIVYSPNRSKKINSLSKKEKEDSHKIVEECMLIANKIAAKQIIKINKESRQLGLFRNHDLPTLQNENYIKDIIEKFSSEKKVSNKLSVKLINDFLRKFDNSSSRNILSLLLIRKMKKAFYSSKNIGHYGLGFKEYTHFTSPIRRYSDLLVHRILKKQNNNISESIDFCNLGEVKAKLANRDYLRLKGLRWLKSQTNQTLEGIIVNIKPSHLLICETGTEITGYIDVKKLPRDLYVLSSNKLTLMGKYSKNSYGIGEILNIKVSEIDIINLNIAFEIK